MTKSEAMLILDEIKNGLNYPEERINQALIVTGDLRVHSRPLHEVGEHSPYIRSRSLYGASAYERIFGPFQGFGQGCKETIGATQ